MVSTRALSAPHAVFDVHTGGEVHSGDGLQRVWGPEESLTHEFTPTPPLCTRVINSNFCADRITLNKQLVLKSNKFAVSFL